MKELNNSNVNSMRKNISRNKRNFISHWMMWLLSLLVFCSLGLFALSWLTDFFSDAIISNLQLRNGSLSFAWWQRPAVRAVYRIRIFNFTNVEDFEAGKAEKLRVHEVGPYIYRETLNRVNPEIGDNSTLTYQEMRSYQWVGGNPDDEIVTVPNVPLFTAMAFSRDMSFLAQVSLTAVLSTIRVKPFIKVPVGDFLWGYDDELFRIARPLMSWQQNIPYDKFGILAFKVGLSKDRMTIKTGIDNLKELGNTVRINDEESRDIWHDRDCDKIEGSDGSIFPPQMLRDHTQILKVYVKEMCRSIPLQYFSESHAKGIPTLRYKLPEDVFTINSNHNPCYCQKNIDNNGKTIHKCPLKGIFNTSACNFGAPMLSSFPHFYQADESLLGKVDGLRPNQELHDTYVDLHPRLGVPIGGWSRVQVNLEARKADAVPFMGHVADGTVLPLLWIEVGIDEIPESVMSILYHAHYTAGAVEACLQWGSLMGLFLSAFLLCYLLGKGRLDEHKTLHRNTSGQNPLINK